MMAGPPCPRPTNGQDPGRFPRKRESGSAIRTSSSFSTAQPTGGGPRLASSSARATSTTLIAIASFGQPCTHAGASPTFKRSVHMSHLRTMPLALLYWGTSYGQVSVQYWQPMH
jgi:hypothetical protein